ncbi:MAG: [Fe-Fe] hydrogenase large subunit C-terminal domain-containing protein [Peptostreptococcales bacterium]
MEEKYIGFNEKRMYVFGELVKRYWDGHLNDVTDLKQLALEIKNKYSFSDIDLPFIKDHIRVAMGQNPKGPEEFSDELSLVKKCDCVSQPVVARIEGPCNFCHKENCECKIESKYDTEIYRRNNSVITDEDIQDFENYSAECDFGALAEKIEFMPLVDLLKSENELVYAVVAPAIVGQFGNDVTMGKLRTALKLIGFKDMIEVALFADVLTIKEAFEFNDLVKNEEDFFLTSCCCPVWFNMIKKNYPNVYRYMSPSVSPMIASGRILKRLYKDAKVVFIAPCIAKKAEIKEPDLLGAIDYVLNFRELKEVFNALGISVGQLHEDGKDQASLGGRLYARTGGVSFSVKTVVNRLEPKRVIKLKPKKVNGVKECKSILDDLQKGKKVDANFIEGMGCPDGCVGGPRTNISAREAIKYVNDFGEESFILTPFDNYNVMKILKQFGIHSIEEIMENLELKKLLSREKVDIQKDKDII